MSKTAENTRKKFLSPAFAGEQSNSHSNFRNTPDSELLDFEEVRQQEPEYSVETVQGTPFWLIKNEQGCFLTFGNRVLTAPKQTKEEALELLNTQRWEIQALYTLAIIDMKTKVADDIIGQ